MKSTAKAHLAVLFTNLFFASNYSLVKYISPSLVKPYGLNIIRVGVSVIIFWLLWLMSRTSASIRREHLLRFLLCGLTGVAINQMLFIKGLTMTSTIHASLLMLCSPLLITLFAFWALKERVTWLKISGLVMGVGGAILLMSSGQHTGTASLLGDVFLILNAISYAIYFILVKPLMQAYSPLHVMRWVFTLGLCMMLPLGWMQFSEINWSSFDLSQWAALGSIVIFGTFLAYSFNIYGIRHLGAGITGSYIYTQPVLAALVAMVFLNEKFTWQMAVSGVLIFAGVFLVSRKGS